MKMFGALSSARSSGSDRADSRGDNSYRGDNRVDNNRGDSTMGDNDRGVSARGDSRRVERVEEVGRGGGDGDRTGTSIVIQLTSY